MKPRVVEHSFLGHRPPVPHTPLSQPTPAPSLALDFYCDPCYNFPQIQSCQRMAKALSCSRVMLRSDDIARIQSDRTLL